jgi:hypothetical protein
MVMEQAELKEQLQHTKLLRIIARLIGFTVITGVAGSILTVFSGSIINDNGFILGMFILIGWLIGLMFLFDVTETK